MPRGCETLHRPYGVQGCLANGCDQGYECDELTTQCKPQASRLGSSAAAACVHMTVADEGRHLAARGARSSDAPVGHSRPAPPIPHPPRPSLLCTPQGCLASGCKRGYECNKYTTECEAQVRMLGIN